jgi:hypothetical protein
MSTTKPWSHSHRDGETFRRHTSRLGQAAPLRRSPQPVSRCARPAAGKDLSRDAGVPDAGYAGAALSCARGKHLARLGPAGGAGSSCVALAV